MPTSNSSDDLEQTDLEQTKASTNQPNFLDRPMVKAFVRNVSQRLSSEKIAPPKSEPPTVKDKVTTIILPALVVGGLGGFAITYPNFLSDFDFHYVRGNGFSAIFIFLFVLFLKLAWNQIGGGIAIALSLIAIVRCLLPNQPDASTPEPIEPQPSNESSQKTIRQEAVHLGLQAGLEAGQHFIARRKSRRSRKGIEN